MAKQDKEHQHEETLVELEPVKAIERETKNLVASSKVFIYLIIRSDKAEKIYKRQ